MVKVQKYFDKCLSKLEIGKPAIIEIDGVRYQTSCVENYSINYCTGCIKIETRNTFYIM